MNKKIVFEETTLELPEEIYNVLVKDMVEKLMELSKSPLIKVE